MGWVARHRVDRLHVVQVSLHYSTANGKAVTLCNASVFCRIWNRLQNYGLTLLLNLPWVEGENTELNDNMTVISGVCVHVKERNKFI